MDSTFDTELNTDVHKNFSDSTSLTVGDVAGGAVASVVDIGASLWNSLPGTPDVETGDLLKRMNAGGALQVYNEHPDAIHTASFIGGMFVPMGIATKALKLGRAGVSSASWLNYASREAEIAKAATIFDEAGAATTAYRNLTRSIYAKSAVNQAIDAVAMEAALVGMYHAHPFMEDYMTEPYKNFALSAAFGGVLGGAVGHIADRFALREATGAVAEKALADTVLSMRDISPSMTNATALQTHWLNQQNLDKLMTMRGAIGKTETNDLAFAWAKQAKTNTFIQQEKLFNEMVSPAIRDLPPEEKQVIMNKVINSPELFGVESISLFTEKEINAMTDKGIIKAPNFDLTSAPSLTGNQSSKGPVIPKNRDAVYFPEFGLYGTKQDAVHYAGAATLKKDAEQLAKDLAYNSHKIPNLDSSLELVGKSSAHAEAEYIANLVKIDKMSLNEFKNIVISETDGPMLSAVITRMQKDPEAAKLVIETTDRSPIYQQVLQKRTEELISQGKIVPNGPDANYVAAVDKFAGGRNIDKFRPNSVSVEARSMLGNWIAGGGVAKMRRAAVDYFGSKTGGFGAVSSSTKEGKIFGELYESTESKALRAEFQKLADADGNVFLYRGWKTDNIKGHAPLESYTTHPDKAEQFGTLKHGHTQGGVKLYKVPVDDIVAGFSDIGGGKNTAEIIVRASARPVEATLDAQGNLIFKKQQAAGQVVKTTVETTTIDNVKVGGNKAYLADLQQMLIAQKEDAIDTLLANGIPTASIAKKTNTTLDAVEYYATTKDAGGSLADLITANPQKYPGVTSLNAIKSVEDANNALKPTNQPLILSGNLRKNQFVENHIALDNKAMTDMDKEVKILTLLGSKSTAANELGQFLVEQAASLDILKSQLGAVNTQKAGSAFWNSFDAFARKMKDVGPIASLIGKEVQRIANSLEKIVVGPIEQHMATAITDEAAVLEFNLVANVNASLTGYRKWSADGKLLQEVPKIGTDGKTVMVWEPVHFQGKPFQIKTESVLKLVHEIQDKSSELRSLANTINKILGKPDIKDIGFWMPSFNPVNKFIAYVHNPVTNDTKLLWARTSNEFEDMVKSYKEHLQSIGDETTQVFKKGDEQEMYSILHGRLDTINMKRMSVADVTQLKKGKTAEAIVKSDTTIFSEIAGGYQHYISSQMRNLADISMSEITDPLMRMSVMNKAATAGQPLDKIKKIVNAPNDPAAIVKNVLIGSPNLGEYAGWEAVNKTFETGLTMGANVVRDVWNATVAPLTKTLFGGKKELTTEAMRKVDYEKFAAELEKRGVVNPYKIFDDAAAEKWGLSKLEENKDTSKRIIYASNALAATAALRFGELAQPIVNAISLPILTSLAIADKMPKSFMGIQKSTTAGVPGISIMYDGVRAMHSPLFEALNQKWEKMGYFDSLVSEVTNVQRASRRFEKGAIAKIENALDSNIVKVMSKPADYSEALVRKLTMNTGAVLAKKLYPGISDEAVTIFARDFMDKAVGNFHAAQRPVFFQGTAGVALGLFQTYSLTLAQSIYRGLELKNYKALGKAALLQSTIFGGKSMPGFDQISQAIGDHFSDENVDLTTGTFRAVGDSAAHFLLYGLPSNIGTLAGQGANGPSLTGRGDVNPRLPGVNGLVAYNFVKQTAQMMGHVTEGLQSSAPDMARSLGQALSLQSMSRPLARTAELATGYSITTQGNTVQIPEEVWTPTGVFARVLGTRPLQEQVLRDTDHLNRFYGSLDRDNREKAMNTIRTAIRNNTLTDEKLEKAALDYMHHGGTPKGWKSAINTATANTNMSFKEVLLHKLRDDSPLNFMIEHME